MQKTIKIFITLIIIFIIGIFFISLNRNPNYSTENLVGNKLENIKLQSSRNDKIYTDDDFKINDYTLINFWASWCAPCRVEHPHLMKLSKEKKLKIVGINFKDKIINASTFLENLGDPYDYLITDKMGKQSVNFGIYGIPESILIDKELMILKKIVGPLNAEDLNDIKDIIN